MKSAVKAVALFTLPFTLFGAVLAHAQSVPGQFQHVIIVVQENRSPDNLFGGVPSPQPSQYPWFEPGVDLAIAPTSTHNPQGGQPWCLGACFDPGHENNGWVYENKNGYPALNTNGCGLTTATGNYHITYCNAQPVCGSTKSQSWYGCSQPSPINLPTWPEEGYVSTTYDGVGGQSVIAPYVQIATRWGFANYFYQTNQGPSEPAHDFLFGGTSAPSGILAQGYYNYFDANNPSSSPAGCEGTQQLEMINPDGNFKDQTYGGPVYLGPCFEHLTMSDLLETNKLTWKYYTPTPNGIWTAPNSIGHICLQSGTAPGSSTCNNTDFTVNVLPPSKFFKDLPSGGTNILTSDLCALPNVAWIIPDGANSDHAGLKSPSDPYSTDIEGGPNWVATIVNAVGQATCKEPAGPYAGQPPWEDTVILVVWDDWGGWY